MGQVLTNNQRQQIEQRRVQLEKQVADLQQQVADQGIELQAKIETITEKLGKRVKFTGT